MKRLGIVRLLVLAMILGVMAPVVAGAQSSGEPVFDSDQVTSSLLGKITLEQLPSDPQLLLQSLTIGGGETLPAHTSDAPEVLYAQTGSFLVLDDFGFSTEVAEGSSVGLNASTRYILSNGTGLGAEVYRLSLGPGTEEPVVSAAATPTDGTVVASPMAVTEPHTLFSIPISMSGDGPWTLFLADTQWDAVSELEPQDHAGPIVVMPYGSQGLTITSPSGIQGLVAPDQAVLIPEGSPFVARNDNQEEATALVAGLVVVGTSLLSEIVATPIPISTSAPSAVPTSTPIPSPTPDQSTAPGAVLSSGQTWKAPGLSMTMRPTLCWGAGFGFDIELTNTGTSRVDVVVKSSNIMGYDDRGQVFMSSRESEKRVILEPGQSETVGAPLVLYLGDSSCANLVGNYWLAIDDVGPIARAVWGFTLNKSEVLPLPADITPPPNVWP